MSYVNRDALARRKARIQAKETASRTVNHEAINRRHERLKAQQSEEYANDMPRDTNVYDSPEKAFENALGGDIFAQVFKDSNLI